MDEKKKVCPVTLEMEGLDLTGSGGRCSGCGVMFIPRLGSDRPVLDCIEQFREHSVEREDNDSDCQ